ncbi:MAG: MFS transporter [Hyphomonadaceae bacterium]|nr:MFS transporter [Hyphomonadaceae bacterium]
MSRSKAPAGRLRVVLALGTAETLIWASTYYLPAILAVPMARDLGVPNAWLFGAVTAALLVMGAAGPLIGREIDRRGGRIVLAWGNVVVAGGLILLAVSQGMVSLAAAWLVLGVGMAMSLYDAAFAALAGIYGRAARGPITGITLFGGFASTIGWPISAAVEAAYGWRSVCVLWAVVNLTICLPLNMLLPKPQAGAAAAAQASTATEDVSTDRHTRRAIWLLALMFSVAWFVGGAMATHLPRLLQEMGATTTAAIAAGALIGPAQVAARLVEFGLFRNLHPLISGRIAVAMHPIGGLVLVLVGGPAAAAFAVLHGAGNGLLTIVRGTLPLALFGSTAYGLRQGLLGAPARLTQATSPFLFGLVLDTSPMLAIALSSLLMLIALACLLMLRARGTSKAL